MLRIVSRRRSGLAAPLRAAGRITPEGWAFHPIRTDREEHSRSEMAAWLRDEQQQAFAHHFVDVPHNFYVDTAGRVWEGRGWSARPAKNGLSRDNNRLWAVGVMVDGRVSDGQAASLLWLLQDGARLRSAAATVTHVADLPAAATVEVPSDEERELVGWLNRHLLDFIVLPDIADDHPNVMFGL